MAIKADKNKHLKCGISLQLNYQSNLCNMLLGILTGKFLVYLRTVKEIFPFKNQMNI